MLSSESQADTTESDTHQHDCPKCGPQWTTDGPRHECPYTRLLPCYRCLGFGHTESCHTHDGAWILQSAGRGFRTVYVVTANYQSRRARRLFRQAAGGRLRVLVYPATDDWFNPDTWWQSREGRKVFLMECLGLHSRE